MKYVEDLSGDYESEIEGYRAFAMRAAKELKYGKEVIQRLEEATTDDEIYRIMKNSREKIEDLPGKKIPVKKIPERALSADEVRDIRKSNLSCVQLAEKYRVSSILIRRIWNGTSYGDVK